MKKIKSHESFTNEANNYKVPAVNFIGTLLVNVDNEKLSDADFREFFRNTISIVEKPSLESIANEATRESIKKYYK